MAKTTEAQRRATRKWEKKNPQKTRLDSYKRGAFNFVKQANIDRLEQLENLKKALDVKIEELKKGEIKNE